jgi:hypothetical protein
VQDEYFDAAARACVEYDIMDLAEASTIGVDTIALYDESANELWTNMEYQASLQEITLHSLLCHTAVEFLAASLRSRNL